MSTTPTNRKERVFAEVPVGFFSSEVSCPPADGLSAPAIAETEQPTNAADGLVVNCRPNEDAIPDPANEQPGPNVSESGIAVNNNQDDTAEALLPCDSPSPNTEDEPSEECPLPLLPQHLEELRRSGLSDETIREARIYSEEDRGRVADILGRVSVAKKNVPALVIPFQGPDGSSYYFRVKPAHPRIHNGKTVKYESPVGRPNEIYIPPFTRDRLLNTLEPVYLTEGEKKGLCLSQYTYLGIGLVGIWGWKKPGQEQLHLLLDRIDWQGRDVYIVFDSDVRHNPDVQAAEWRLVVQLKRKGANVRVVRLPDGPPDEQGNPAKVGVDDFIVQHGVEAFQQLVVEAEEPAEPNGLQVKRPASSVDPYTKIQELLGHFEEDGESRLRYWRGSWYLHEDGHYGQQADMEIEGILVRWLNESTNRLTKGIVANHMMQLMAQASLSNRINPPAWVGDPPVDWLVDEILPCRNGLIHLPSIGSPGEYFHEPTPRFFAPTALDCDFDLNAPRPDRWLAFLYQIFSGNQENINLVQEWFAYCLTPNTRHQKIFLGIGPPRSGKGTLAKILIKLIGERNVVGPTLASLGGEFGLQPLLDKSLAIIGDARLGTRSDIERIVGILLDISGEDTLTIPRKHSSAITGKLNTRLMLFANELPRFVDAGGALANRMLISRTTESFLGREDPFLFSKLEPELPGILLWAVAGWQRLWRRGRFVVPDSSRRTQQELADLASPVAAFVRERCVVGPEYFVARAELYKAFDNWCRDQCISPKDSAYFGKDLRAVLPTIDDGREWCGRVRIYPGIALQEARPTTQPQTNPATGSPWAPVAGSTPVTGPGRTGACPDGGES